VRGWQERGYFVQAQQWRWQEDATRNVRQKAPVEVDMTKTVHVKNIPFSASEDDVSAYFSRAGNVVRSSKMPCNSFSEIRCCDAVHVALLW
jgi:RNA recognition motif-containing protein